MISAEVSLSGVFFRGNPIGRLRVNAYNVLKDEAAVAQDVAQSALLGKARNPTGRLAGNIVIVPRRRRGGRLEVLVSANYGDDRLVRFYNRFIDTGVRKGMRVRRGYRFYPAGARAAQAHIDSRVALIERRLVEGIT